MRAGVRAASAQGEWLDPITSGSLPRAYFLLNTAGEKWIVPRGSPGEGQATRKRQGNRCENEQRQGQGLREESRAQQRVRQRKGLRDTQAEVKRQREGQQGHGSQPSR